MHTCQYYEAQIYTEFQVRNAVRNDFPSSALSFGNFKIAIEIVRRDDHMMSLFGGDHTMC